MGESKSCFLLIVTWRRFLSVAVCKFLLCSTDMKTIHPRAKTSGKKKKKNQVISLCGSCYFLLLARRESNCETSSYNILSGFYMTVEEHLYNTVGSKDPYARLVRISCTSLLLVSRIQKTSVCVCRSEHVLVYCLFMFSSRYAQSLLPI